MNKKGVITTSCKACGFAGTISSQDKLNTYIVKYPPVQKVAAAGHPLQPKSESKLSLCRIMNLHLGSSRKAGQKEERW